MISAPQVDVCRSVCCRRAQPEVAVEECVSVVAKCTLSKKVLRKLNCHTHAAHLLTCQTISASSTATSCFTDILFLERRGAREYRATNIQHKDLARFMVIQHTSIPDV